MANAPESVFGEHPFWSFSLDVYGRDGVAPAAIALQDRHGIDVNMLLFCLWVGASGRRLAAGDLARVAAAAEDWNREVVRPIRAARRRMKSPPGELERDAVESLRRQVLSAEIATERAEQMLIARLAAAPAAAAGSAPPAEAAAGNLANWLAARSLVPAPEDRGAFATILAAALGAADGAAALEALFEVRPGGP